MASREPGFSFPTRISRCRVEAARSESVSVPAASALVPAVIAGIPTAPYVSTSRLFQHQLVEVELALQHVLLAHDIDPPLELLALQYRLRIIRGKHPDHLQRLLGEFSDRGAGLV